MARHTEDQRGVPLERSEELMMLETGTNEDWLDIESKLGLIDDEIVIPEMTVLLFE